MFPETQVNSGSQFSTLDLDWLNGASTSSLLHGSTASENGNRRRRNTHCQPQTKPFQTQSSTRSTSQCSSASPTATKLASTTHSPGLPVNPTRILTRPPLPSSPASLTPSATLRPNSPTLPFRARSDPTWTQSWPPSLTSKSLSPSASTSCPPTRSAPPLKSSPMSDNLSSKLIP